MKRKKERKKMPSEANCAKPNQAQSLKLLNHTIYDYETTMTKTEQKKNQRWREKQKRTLLFSFFTVQKKNQKKNKGERKWRKKKRKLNSKVSVKMSSNNTKNAGEKE